jgi:hypothetical protein
MVPSVFNDFNVGGVSGVHDEWTVAQFVDRNVAKARLERSV